MKFYFKQILKLNLKHVERIHIQDLLNNVVFCAIILIRPGYSHLRIKY